MVKRISKKISRFTILLIFLIVPILVVGRYFGLFSSKNVKAAEKYLTIVAEDVSRPFVVRSIRKEYEEFELDPELAKLDDGFVPGTVPVLVYHDLPDVAVNEPDVTIESFKQQMFALKKLGYQTITLTELQHFLGGETELEERSIVISFDDGISNSYKNSDILFEALDFNAVMFAITGHSLGDSIRGSYYLKRNFLREMLASGRWEVQSHGHTSHFRGKVSEDGDQAPALANRLWLKSEDRLETEEEYFIRVGTDLHQAKIALEEAFGHSVFAFAAPFNDFGQLNSNYDKALDVVMKNTWDNYNLFFYQFRSPLTGEYRSNFPNDLNSKKTVTRISAGNETTTQSLVKTLLASEKKLLPYIEDFQNSYSWVDAWGDNLMESDHISVNSESNSSFTYLDGTYEWSNYLFETDIEWNSGQVVSLVSYMLNAFEYLDCEYNLNGRVQLVWASKSIPTGSSILSKTTTNLLGEGSKKLAMRVDETSATCFIEEIPVLTAELPAEVKRHGGVGIKTWNPQAGLIDIAATAIKASSLDAQKTTLKN